MKNIPSCKHKTRKVQGNGLCGSCYQMDYRKRNPEKYREWLKRRHPKQLVYLKEWRDKNKEKMFVYHLRHKYGIEKEDYNKLLKQQESRCAICGLMSQNLHIDHSHLSGKIRGLLCELCNKGLGLFRDNSELLKRATEYLIKNV